MYLSIKGEDPVEHYLDSGGTWDWLEIIYNTWSGDSVIFVSHNPCRRIGFHRGED